MNEKAQPPPSPERTTPTKQSEAPAKLYSPAPAGKPAGFASDSATLTGRSVELHIDELVLNGFDPAHRYRIGDAIERELTRLFNVYGAPVSITEDVEIAHLNGGEIEMPNSKAEEMGRRVAKAIYGGFAN